MALAGGSSRILCSTPNRTPGTHIHLRRPFLKTSSPSWSQTPPFTVSASPKKLSSSSSSRTGRFDSKNRKTSPVTTKEQEEETLVDEGNEIAGDEFSSSTTAAFDDGFVMPELPGDKPDPFEGSQWDALGFFVQYMWAFGIVFALVACGIAVATYNEGATDFKDTPAYKESIESREFPEEPDASNSNVFDSNPTEQAPSLE
ncbi:hypothetical protein BUALT_Bualt07G0080700 [Buddleja alternifolia]|uniref:Uncharacterized protein n=1 Tax=Buddleja alternifolia TaxID=168488 RepID=A0AAV6XFN2_9LAMI|nr:hypothetical protein BUALT_Bualt07G0080700 [Buddleja alternifolia]